MQLFKNNAYSTLTGALTSGSATLTVSAATGDRFPIVTGTDYFMLTLQDAANNIEIVKVTARASASDSMTITRAQEGTTARSWSIGDIAEHRVTAGSLAALKIIEGVNTATDILNKLGALTIGQALFQAVDAASARLAISVQPTDSPTFTGTPAVPTATADTSTTQIASTAFVVGQAGASVPAAAGGAAVVGISKKFARDDHVHPSVGVTQAAGDSSTNLATTAFVDALRDVPANAQAGTYTLALADRGKSIDANGNVTIPANATVAFPVGAVVTVTNVTAGNLTIAITTDTLRLAGTATTGTRTLAQYGVATMRKVSSTVWIAAGAGLT